MNSASVLAANLRVHDDDEVGGIDRRDRREIAHQFVFALRRRHQRFVRRLRVRHHQERVAVGRRFDDLLRADHAAGAGAVLDHDRLAELLLQHVADQARRHVGRSSGAEGNDDPDRPRRVILRETGGGKIWQCKKDCGQRERKPWGPHFNLPGILLLFYAGCWPNPAQKSSGKRRLSTKDSLCPIGIKDNFRGTKSRPNQGTIK